MKENKGVDAEHAAAKHTAEHHPLRHVGEHPMMQTGGTPEGAASRVAMNEGTRSYGKPPTDMPMDSIRERR
jgi:hypothetical protein